MKATKHKSHPQKFETFINFLENKWYAFSMHLSNNCL